MVLGRRNSRRSRQLSTAPLARLAARLVPELDGIRKSKSALSLRKAKLSGFAPKHHARICRPRRGLAVLARCGAKTPRRRGLASVLRACIACQHCCLHNFQHTLHAMSQACALAGRLPKQEVQDGLLVSQVFPPDQCSLLHPARHCMCVANARLKTQSCRCQYGHDVHARAPQPRATRCQNPPPTGESSSC